MNGHARTASLPDDVYRRNSLSGSDTTSASDTASSVASGSVHLGAEHRYDSRPTTAGSGADPSPQLGARDPQQQPHAHDGFSSAFGLMSLDDPAVLAGLAADSQPFFSTLGGALQTPTPARERERAGAGGVFPAGDRDRDAELRDLREFWRQYMRTPLSGGGPLGATPSASANAALAASGGILGAAARPGMGKRGLSRVASMPSVKTPGVELAAPHFRDDAAAVPAPARTYLAAEDLRRYEAAVLSRKAPQLSLVPRKKSGLDQGQGSSPYSHGQCFCRERG
jgi:hypothetical protein